MLRVRIVKSLSKVLIRLPNSIAHEYTSPSFKREYNLKYLGLVVNVFFTKDIKAALEKGKGLRNLNSYKYLYAQRSVGLDSGFGSSAFGVCITELVATVTGAACRRICKARL